MLPVDESTQGDTTHRWVDSNPKVSRLIAEKQKNKISKIIKIILQDWKYFNNKT